MFTKLPKFCGARNPVNNAPISLMRGKNGYLEWPTEIKMTPEQYNEARHITQAVVDTMMACSMADKWDDASVAMMLAAFEKQTLH